MSLQLPETRSPHRFRAFFGSLIVAVLGTLVLPLAAHAELRAATLRHDAMVYRQPNDTAQVLGRLKEGKAIRIYYPDRNGWYAVAFSQPIQGAKYGWVHAEDLDVGSQVASSPAGSPSRDMRPKRTWVDLTLDLHDTSPSAFQTAIGESGSSFFAKGFGLEFGHRITNVFGLAFKGFYYSWSQSASAQAGGNYGASGYGLTAGADFLLMAKRGFQLSLGAGVGLSINQAQNSSSQSGLQTTNIMAYPLYGKVSARDFFGNGAFGVLAELGYEIQSLSAVPVQTVTGNTTSTTASVNVGGLVFSLGLALQF